jgi:hypothetical protein
MGGGCERWHRMGCDSSRDFQLIFVTCFRSLVIRNRDNMGRCYCCWISLVGTTDTEGCQCLRTTAEGNQRRCGATAIIV